MLDYQQLWQPQAIGRDQTLELHLGALHLWIRRGGREWHFAYENKPVNEERFSVDVTDAPMPEEPDSMRWILDAQADRIHFVPCLPDRPLVVRPEMPMCLMPKQSVQLFIGIPLWLAIAVGEKREQVAEVPTLALSNSWFGPTTDGELCYAMKTTAKLQQQDLFPSASRVVFPLEIRNPTHETLRFERLCIRPQYLNVFLGETRLWTSKGRVTYRGEDNWSRIVYSSKPPEFDHAGRLVGKARETLQRGALLHTFDSLKQRVEL